MYGQPDHINSLCRNIDVEVARYNRTAQVFPKLKRMALDNLPNLESWTEDSAREANTFMLFPQLEEVRIYDCFKLTSLPESLVLKNLTCISFSIRAFVSMNMPLMANFSQLKCWAAGKRSDTLRGPAEPRPKTFGFPAKFGDKG